MPQGHGAAGIAISEGILVAANPQHGIETATVGPAVPILSVDPALVAVDADGHSIHDVSIKFGVAPNSHKVIEAHLEIRDEEDNLIFDTTVPVADEGEVIWPKGRSLEVSPTSISFEVRNPDGTVSNTFVGGSLPTPVLTSLTPSVVEAGTDSVELQINGRGFLSASQVNVLFPDGQIETLTPDFVDSTSINIHLSEKHLTRTGRLSFGLVSDFAISDSLDMLPSASSNILELAVLPVGSMSATLTSVSPNRITVGTSPVVITLFGEGFLEDESVARLDGYSDPLPTSFVSSNELQAEITADVLQEPRILALRVASLQAPILVSESKTVEVVSNSTSAPMIASVVPIDIPLITPGESDAVELYLYGSGFQPGAQVFASVDGQPLVPLPTLIDSPQVLSFNLTRAEWAEKRLEVTYEITLLAQIKEEVKRFIRPYRIPQVELRWNADVFESFNKPANPHDRYDVGFEEIGPVSNDEMVSIEQRVLALVRAAYSDWEIDIMKEGEAQFLSGPHIIEFKNIHLVGGDIFGMTQKQHTCGATSPLSFDKKSAVNTSFLSRLAEGYAKTGEPPFVDNRYRVIIGIATGIGNTAVHELAHQLCRKAVADGTWLVDTGKIINYEFHTCSDFAHFYGPNKTWGPARPCLDEKLEKKALKSAER